MRKKVATNHLKFGMYVVELDRPWDQVPFEHPFQIQGFTLQTVEEIEKVKKLCAYVYIDPSLGTDADRYLPDDHPFQQLIEVMQTFPGKAVPDFYEETNSFEQEVGVARQILDDAQHVYEKVLTDVQAGQELDSKAVKKSINELVDSVLRNPAASAWLVRLKRKDKKTYSHSLSVAILAITVGRHLGLPKKNLETLGTATMLQDIGKVHLPTTILNKPGPLTDRERRLTNLHVDASVAMLHATKEFTLPVINIVANHHERYDGSGYPRKLAKKDIDLLASVAGLVDTYCALTSERPYRKAKTTFDALMDIYSNRDQIFPTPLVEQFIQCVGIFPVGSFVRLNTGEIAVVVKRNRIQQLKPRVLILIGEHGERLLEPLAVDLAAQYLEPDESPRSVAQVVDPEVYNLDPSDFFV